MSLPDQILAEPAADESGPARYQYPHARVSPGVLVSQHDYTQRMGEKPISG
jgi:hypothetical protein